MPRKLTQDEFVARAREVHGDTYDYSMVTYKRSSTPVTVVCRHHGEFHQTPESHLAGRGCPSCGRVRQVKSAATPLDDVFEYTRKSRYAFPRISEQFKNASSHLSAHCCEHGEFTTTLTRLKQGKGCRKCGHKRRVVAQRVPKSEFIARAKVVHGDRFDYSLVEYARIEDKVRIICPDHGVFVQNALSHLYSCGCPDCALISNGDKRRMSVDDLYRKCLEVHGDRYTYDFSTYKNQAAKVRITCGKHGDFLQSMGHHIHEGTGCPRCSAENSPGGFRPQRPGYFYVYRIVTRKGEFAGFGITASVGFRDLQHQESFKAHGARGEIVDKFWFTSGYAAEELEDIVMRRVVRESTGIPGFIREASPWSEYREIMKIATEYHDRCTAACTVTG